MVSPALIVQADSLKSTALDTGSRSARIPVTSLAMQPRANRVHSQNDALLSLISLLGKPKGSVRHLAPPRTWMARWPHRGPSTSAPMLVSQPSLIGSVGDPSPRMFDHVSFDVRAAIVVPRIPR